MTVVPIPVSFPRSDGCAWDGLQRMIPLASLFHLAPCASESRTIVLKTRKWLTTKR